ncbi:DNA mismatch repair endonuclease MutL [Halalkalicoccus ordinarius]|uniref:DNA mismatch repair endonuclease MutL n=1 Tax=Halalkalicoccus ordinarius TaxID=3116651 RepID=UPI00300EFAA4
MTRPEIHELDAATVDRIAAGEVVERPASVVKELVENALDADASSITVEIDSGGVDRIRVVDDGIGMTENELRTAVKQHTTSKLRDASDLEAGIETLGFRGEALHTIGAVSRTTITTRARGTEGAGTKLILAGGEVESVEPAGPPTGTAVEVSDLFFNTPARRKYLKREATEFDHVNTVVTRYALANPEVAFTLEHDGREVFSTTGQGGLRATILAVYGREVARAMVPIEDVVEGPLEAITGYVSDPETTRSSPTYVSTFVNGRYVRSGALRGAVVDAYGTQLAPDRYPFAVLDLSVPAETVDVNVHPRKMEVKFEEEAAIREQIEASVERALLDHGLVRASAPRGRSAPEETTVAPEPDTETETETEEATGEANFEGTASAAGVESAAKAGEEAGTGSSTGTERAAEPRRSVGESASADRDGDERETTPRRDEPRFVATEQSTLDGPAAGPEAVDEGFERLPDLRVLGQLRDTYVVAEGSEGLVLVDQHAADERVQYERLRGALSGGTTTQALVEPVEIGLTAREAELFDAHAEALSRLGFSADREGRVARVRTVPAVFDATLSPELLRDALGECVSGDPGETVDATVDGLLADLACYPAVTGNVSLAEGSVVSLLSALDDCENPYACPHGRPTLIRVDNEELADRFERDYPGHASRRERE